MVRKIFIFRCRILTTLHIIMHQMLVPAHFYGPLQHKATQTCPVDCYADATSGELERGSADV